MSVAGVLEGDTLVAAIEHFSKYVVMAQAAALGAPGPAVVMQAPVPASIRAGAPIYLRATVLPSASTSIAAVRVHYRRLHPAGQAYTVAVMVPDSSPATPGTNTYGHLVPAAMLGAGDLAAGDDFEYFAEATDTLGVTRTLAAAPVAHDVTRLHAPGSLTLGISTLEISAGFERWLPLMAQDDLSSAYQIVPESVEVTRCPGSGQPALGEVRDGRAAGVHFAARRACSGTLSAGAGGELASVAVTVRSGHLAELALYRYELVGGTEVRTRFDGTHAISEGQVLEVDALGEDGHGNTMHVNVSWEADAALGTIDGDGRLYTLDGGGFGRITASVGGLGGVRAAQWIHVLGRSWQRKGEALNVAAPATWVSVPAQPPRPWDLAIGLVTGEVLVLSQNGDHTYHPATNSLTLRNPPNLAVRINAVATALADGRVMAASGGVIELYDPRTRGWTATAGTLTSRTLHQLVQLTDRRVLAIGGGGAPGIASVEAYDLATNAWSFVAPMRVARLDHAATRLRDGTVLVSGGSNAATGLSSAEIYDPATNQWTLTGSMGIARRDHVQVLLPSGKVLAIGGSSVAELYDPATGRWAAAGNMSTSRSPTSAALLGDGRVLVASGTTADVYDPRTGAWSALPPMSAIDRPVASATTLANGRVLVTGAGFSATTAELYLPSQPAPRPSLVSGGGAAYVAWHEPNAVANRVYVRQWSGASWTPLGTGAVSPVAREASAPRLAVNALTGAPSVVWQELGTGGSEVQVRRWNGTAWVQDGAGSLNIDANHQATAPAIAFSGPTPYVAWQEAGMAASQIYVRRWNGTAWVQLGGSLNRDPSRAAAAPSIIVIGAAPYVAWREAGSSGEQVYVARWDGVAWVGVGRSLNVDPVSIASEPTAMEVNGAPYVSWREEQEGGAQVHLARWDGVAWVPEGPPLSADPAMSPGMPSPGAAHGTPYLALREVQGGAAQLVVKHRSAGNWVQNGSSLNWSGNRDAFHPSLTFLGSTPWVAWAEANGVTSSVYVKALE